METSIPYINGVYPDIIVPWGILLQRHYIYKLKKLTHFTTRAAANLCNSVYSQPLG
jgi:hypothetical protein